MTTRLAIDVERLGADLLALAQCIVLDVATFPHPSLPPVLVGPLDGQPAWLARDRATGAVVGFLSARWHRGALEVNGLAVDERSRRAGAGRALLGAAIGAARARAVGAVVLHVSTANVAARALYRSEGFRESRLLPCFYPAGHFPDDGNALEMVLELP